MPAAAIRVSAPNPTIGNFCINTTFGIVLHRPWAGVTDHLAVNIGTELLGIVPGRVSTEVDAHLSYDTQATIDKARHLQLSDARHQRHAV